MLLLRFYYDIYNSAGYINFFYDGAGQLVAEHFLCHGKDVVLLFVLGNL